MSFSRLQTFLRPFCVCRNVFCRRIFRQHPNPKDVISVRSGYQKSTDKLWRNSIQEKNRNNVDKSLAKPWSRRWIWILLLCRKIHNSETRFFKRIFFIRSSCVTSLDEKWYFYEENISLHNNDFQPDLFASFQAESFTNSSPVVIHKVFKFVLSVSRLLSPSSLLSGEIIMKRKFFFHPRTKFTFKAGWSPSGDLSGGDTILLLPGKSRN